MARVSNGEKLRRKHEFFLQDFNQIWAASQSERLQSVMDRRFYSISGAQYEDMDGNGNDDAPRFEYNKTHQSVIRVFNEYRNNRISVMFRPDDADSSSETADTLTGRYRADEQRCNAQEAYDNAFEESVGGGMGAFQYVVQAADDEDADNYDSQDLSDEDTAAAIRIGIEPIYDADTSVFFNLDAKRQDKADARRGYRIYSVTRTQYLADNPGVNPSSWPKSSYTNCFDWCTADVIYIADVYEIELARVTLHIYQSKLTQDELSLTDDELKDTDYIADLEAQGYFHARDEKTKRRKVHKYRMNGAEITGDFGYIPGRCIPIIPTYGKRWFVDNIERFMGQVRLQKDMQRVLNMVINWLAEVHSVTSTEVPILTPQQVLGHEANWAQGHLKRHPYRLINPQMGPDGTPQPIGEIPTLKPPVVPPVSAALLQVAVAAMDQLGGGGATPEEGDLASNISGKAVELITKRIDMQSFIFTDNFAKAMKRGGEVWYSMQKDISPEEEYDAPIVKSDGTQDFVKMNTPGIKDGKTVTINDVRRGKYGVTTDVGPSFNSRRDATVRALMGLLSVIAVSDPQEAAVLSAAIVMNVDGEGLEDLRKYYRRKLVKQGVVEPTDEEKVQLQQEAANAPPDANAEFLLAEARKSLAAAQKLMAEATQAQAKTVNVIADTKLKDAQTNKTEVDAGLAVHIASTPEVPLAMPAPEAPAPAPAMA